MNRVPSEVLQRLRALDTKDVPVTARGIDVRAVVGAYEANVDLLERTTERLTDALRREAKLQAEKDEMSPYLIDLGENAAQDREELRTLRVEVEQLEQEVKTLRGTTIAPPQMEPEVPVEARPTARWDSPADRHPEGHDPVESLVLDMGRLLTRIRALEPEERQRLMADERVDVGTDWMALR